MRNKLLKIVREPVILFFLLGFALLLLYTQIVAQFDRSERTITVIPGQIELIAETFQRTWNRPPTESEIEAQIENFIKDEIFFREAVAMGLDKSDPAVKRRLRQLIELMMDDLATVYPSEDQLSNYLSENPDKFRRDPIISFQQIYFSETGWEEAKNQLYNINNNLPVNESTIVNLSLLPNQFSDEPFFGVNRAFGEEFTKSVFELDTGKWQGPIESAYGWHLVYVSQIIPGFVPELSEIWDIVDREWSVEQKKEKKDAQYERIKEKYFIEFEEAKDAE